MNSDRIPGVEYDEVGKVIPELHFGFLLNFFDLQGDVQLPYELAPNHYLDRATPLQVHFINQALRSNLPGRKLAPVLFMYNNDFVIEGDGRATSTRQLDSSNWKYFAIKNTRPENGNYIMSDLTNCLFIAKRMRLALQIRGTPAVGKAESTEFIYPILTYFSKIGAHPVTIPPVSLNVALLDSIKLIYDRYMYIQSKGSEYKFILDAIDFYRQSDAIYDEVKIKTLEYFALIELLLTHNPVDKGDSLTRQLVAKTKLIINRFEAETNLKYFFGETTATLATIISKMYTLRSAVAHGNTIDFTKDLVVLKNQESANNFLTYLLENTILLSLKEPQLIKDLKDC
jgi:hypothetical protein